MSPDERSPLDISQQIAKLEKLPKEQRDAAKPDFWDQGAITAAEAEHSAAAANDSIKTLGEQVTKLDLRLTAFEWLPKAASMVIGAFLLMAAMIFSVGWYFVRRIDELEKTVFAQGKENVGLKATVDQQQTIMKACLPFLSTNARRQEKELSVPAESPVPAPLPETRERTPKFTPRPAPPAAPHGR